MTHTSTLVERHRITIPVGATGDNVAVARLHAEAYARARGFEIPAGSFSVIASTPNGMPMVASGGTLGVAFDVVVGKGDIHLDQRVPGVLDTWTWSAGVADWWRRWLPGGRQGRVSIPHPEGGVAPVIPMPGVLDKQHHPKALGDPTREPGQWNGPQALGGPIPGGGIQHGTGPLPPWLRRGTDEDPDA